MSFRWGDVKMTKRSTKKFIQKLNDATDEQLRTFMAGLEPMELAGFYNFCSLHKIDGRIRELVKKHD